MQEGLSRAEGKQVALPNVCSPDVLDMEQFWGRGGQVKIGNKYVLTIQTKLMQSRLR